MKIPMSGCIGLASKNTIACTDKDLWCCIALGIFTTEIFLAYLDSCVFFAPVITSGAVSWPITL